MQDRYVSSNNRQNMEQSQQSLRLRDRHGNTEAGTGEMWTLMGPVVPERLPAITRTEAPSPSTVGMSVAW